MIPIALVTGFLGSGKTTLLKHLAVQHADRKLVYLVNDFARVDVDGALMQEAGEAVVTIAGGSIFCTCLVTDFIHQLERIHRGEVAFGSAPQGVVIEASGMADPRVFQRMLEETGLDAHFKLTSIITIIDPGRFLKLIHTLPNIRAQVEAADRVVVNKQDLYDDSIRQQAEREIMDIAPGAVIHRTTNAVPDFELFEARVRPGQEGAYATCADPRYASFVLKEIGVGPDELVTAVLSTAKDLYRVKGQVQLNGQPYFVDYEGTRCTAVPSRPSVPGPSSGLVFIVPGPAAAQVQARLESLLQAKQQMA